MSLDGFREPSFFFFLLAVKIPDQLSHSQDKRRCANHPGKETGSVTEVAALPQCKSEQYDNRAREERCGAEANLARSGCFAERVRCGRFLKPFALFAAAFDHRIKNTK